MADRRHDRDHDMRTRLRGGPVARKLRRRCQILTLYGCGYLAGAALRCRSAKRVKPNERNLTGKIHAAPAVLLGPLHRELVQEVVA